MKRILLLSTLLISSTMARAIPTITEYDQLPTGMNIVAKRLASKNITEVVVIAMKLQMECQKLNSRDVCEGVKNILTVLDARVTSLPRHDEDPSITFVKGLMEGVSDANQKTIGTINQIR